MSRSTFRRPLSLLCLLGAAAAPAAAQNITFKSQTFFGGSGDERATGIALVPAGGTTNVYLSGSSLVPAGGLGGEALGLGYTLSTGSFSPQFQWSRTYPGAAGEDQFQGVVASTTSAYFAGYSYSKTTDTVGDKEAKGIVVSLPANGVGTTWERQTPAAPGAFPYGGGESLRGITSGTSSSQPVLYATGSAQSGFANGGRMFLSQLDTAGNILWTRTDTTANPNSSGNALTSFGANVVIAGSTDDSGPTTTMLRRYDDQGNLAWTKTSVAGLLNSVTYDPATNSLFAVGQTTAGAQDFLLQCWDLAGNVVWSRTFDRSGGVDVLTSVAVSNGFYVAAGSTTGGTAGGKDGVVLQFDPATGDLLNTVLWGGSADDSFTGLAFQGDVLHLAGATNSFGSGGSDAAYVLMQASAVPEPSVWLTLGLTTAAACLYAWRRRRHTLALLDQGAPA